MRDPKMKTQEGILDVVFCIDSSVEDVCKKRSNQMNMT